MNKVQPPEHAEVFARLQDIYARMHAEIATHAPVCQISGRCCRFKEYDHTLFLTTPEAMLLVSEGLPPEAVIEPASCPFQQGTLCTARDKRPLGCRVYYCDPSYEMTHGPLIAEKYTRELKVLHEALGLPWDYRPLHQHLDALAAAPKTQANASQARN